MQSFFGIAGEVVVNFNDLTGPKGSKKTPGGPPLLWPDPETKVRPRTLYAAAAVLSAMATVNGTYLCGCADDIRWMFFQFLLGARLV